MATAVFEHLKKVAAGVKPGQALPQPRKERPSVLNIPNRELESRGKIEDSPDYPFGKTKEGWLSRFNLGDMDDTMRKYTVNPALRALLLGGLAGGATYLAGPMIGRLSRSFLRTPQQYDDYGRPVDITAADRRNLAIAAGLGVAGLSGLLSWDKRRPFGGLLKYAPKQMAYPGALAKTSSIEKSAAAFGRSDLIPLNMAKESIMGNPSLSNEMKARSLSVLNAFPSNQVAVNGPSIVDAAVRTGISGLAGYAVGYTTSAALGMGNPHDMGMSSGLFSVLANTLLR